MPPVHQRRNSFPAALMVTAAAANAAGLAVASSTSAESLARPAAITREIGMLTAPNVFSTPFLPKFHSSVDQTSANDELQARSSSTSAGNVTYSVTDSFAKNKFIKFSKASTGIPLALHKGGGDKSDADGIHAYIVPGSGGINYFKYRYPKAMHVKFIGFYVALNNSRVKFPKLTKRTKNAKYVGGYYKGAGGNDITVPTGISGVTFAFDVPNSKK